MSIVIDKRDELIEDGKILTSLAFLAACAEHGADYVDYFLPFLLLALSDTDEYVITPIEAKRLIKINSGFNLPAHVIDLLLRRLEKGGLVQRREGAYEIVGESDELADFLARRRAMQRQIHSVVVAMEQHAKERGLKHWDQARSQAALFELIDDYSVPLLNSAVYGVPLALSEDESNENKYVFATFVNDAESNKQSVFDALVEIVKGSMSANAVLYRDPSRVKARVTDLRLMFDTGFILGYLGYEGRERQELLVDAVRVARSAGAKLRVFSHTLDETMLVLQGVARKLKRPNGGDVPHGNVFHYAREHRIPASQVEVWAANIEIELKKMGVKVDDVDLGRFTPRYSEPELEVHLQKQIGYREESTRARDLKSIACVLALRGVSRYSDIENSKAIFITTNSELMKSTLSFFNDGDLINGVPVVITVDFLTNLLWLKDPNVGADIPKAQVIANIAAGLKVSDRVWKKYLREVDRLSSEGKYDSQHVALLRYSSMAPKELVELTRGREDLVTEDTVDVIFSKIEEDIAGEYGYRLRQLEIALKGPTERLLLVLTVLAWVPSLFLLAIVFSALYIATARLESVIASLTLTIIPTSVFYFAIARRLRRYVLTWLRRQFVGTPG